MLLLRLVLLLLLLVLFFLSALLVLLIQNGTHTLALSLTHSLSLSLSISLSLSLLCFALGLGGWAVPTPRSVERPHPAILKGWAWLYICSFVEWRVPPLQSETRTANQYDQELHTSTITTCVSGPPWHSHFVWACALKRLVLLLNPPYLPEPRLYPERKPYPRLSLSLSISTSTIIIIIRVTRYCFDHR